MTVARPPRYVVNTSFHPTSVYVVDTSTDSCMAVIYHRPGHPEAVQLSLAQQVADLLNAGEAERQRTERLKDQLLEHYSRWLEAASPHDLLKEAQACLPAPEPV